MHLIGVCTSGFLLRSIMRDKYAHENVVVIDKIRESHDPIRIIDVLDSIYIKKDRVLSKKI